MMVMGLNVWIVTSIYLGVAGLGVGIFLWGKPSGNSLFDKLYQLVCIRGPRLIKQILEKCCGKRAPAALDAAWVYLCYTNNPLVQVFYLLVVCGGYLTFAYYGYQRIPNRYLASWHKYLGCALYLVCLYVWWKACRTDPGTVTEKNVKDLIDIWDWDEQIFSKQECQTCVITKPARSKHCALCDVCVARFDHHCIWINNCVGVGNHKWFLAFLFCHLLITAYGAALGSLITYDLIVQKDLLNAIFVDPVTKERHTASYLIIVQYMMATEGMVLFVTALCVVMGVVLCGFYGWHLNLVRVGTTTNELSKWGYLRWCLKQEGEEGKEKLKEMTNIYNLGCVANFREVFFPIDVHNMPGTALEEDNAGEKKTEKPKGSSNEKKGKKAKKNE